ncbi:MAG: plastocyanin [Colwellia sp.]|nr:plastocyanin [Colwellia sp.]
MEDLQLRILSGLLLICCVTACASVKLDSFAKSSKPVVVDVTIKKFKFIPEVLEVSKGQTVRWTNLEKRQYHSVWFEKNGENESEYLFPEDFFEKVFNTVGEFEYRCGPHPEMVGKIIVK